MKAWVLHQAGDIRLEDVNNPVITEQEVLVQVKSAGICGSDIPRIYQTGAHVHPLIPGHEFSGVVVQTGSSVDKQWQGRRVGIFPLIPCGTCLPCSRKKYEMCRHYNYLGSRRDGGFAEYVAVPADNLIALPDEVSFEEAAMLEPMAVAVHAMRRVMPTSKDTAAVCGLGTIGLLLLMFLRDAGVKHIFVIGNKEFQRKMALQSGISEKCYCDSRKENVKEWLLERTGGSGVDVFFECVGKNETMEQAVDLTAPAGRICLVGNPYSDMILKKDVYWKILRNQLLVTGTWNSSFTHEEDDDWHYVLERLRQKKITPAQLISHRFSLDNLEQGYRIMRDKTEDYVKIMGQIE
ncbi:MAG: galactitol-1-phosphate 5-dehydrogenase [Lachnospiraceae bacterium]|nr:galactitol-1-phosphate 5-dehydrogenase [Lachnospiraceae bacterium]